MYKVETDLIRCKSQVKYKPKRESPIIKLKQIGGFDISTDSFFKLKYFVYEITIPIYIINKLYTCT